MRMLRGSGLDGGMKVIDRGGLRLNDCISAQRFQTGIKEHYPCGPILKRYCMKFYGTGFASLVFGDSPNRQKKPGISQSGNP